MISRPRLKGITLIELMIVIVVVAILGSLAVGSYRSYLLRTNRTEAKMALLRIQAAQEKFFLQRNRYADNSELTTAPPNGLGVSASTPSGFYTLNIADYTPTSYRAVANAAAGQLQDSAACQSFSITERGTRLPAEDTGCWR